MSRSRRPVSPVILARRLTRKTRPGVLIGRRAFLRALGVAPRDAVRALCSMERRQWFTRAWRSLAHEDIRVFLRLATPVRRRSRASKAVTTPATVTRRRRVWEPLATPPAHPLMPADLLAQLREGQTLVTASS